MSHPFAAASCQGICNGTEKDSEAFISDKHSFLQSLLFNKTHIISNYYYKSIYLYI